MIRLLSVPQALRASVSNLVPLELRLGGYPIIPSLPLAMDDDQKSQYLAYRTAVKRFRLLLGMWPKENPSLLYRLIPVLQLTLNITSAFATVNFVRVNIHNSSRFTKGIGAVTSFMGSILKALCVIINRKDAYKIHGMLDPHFQKLIDNPELSKIVLADVSTFRRLGALMSILTYFCAFMFITRPLIVIISHHIHHIYPVKYVRIISGVYPWKIAPNGYIYKLTLAAEATSMCFAFANTGGVDLLLTFYVFQMIGQLREMSFRITHTDETKDGRDKNAIRDCIEQHEMLMKCRDILDKIYGPIVLWTMIINALTICLMMFEFSHQSKVSLRQAVQISIYTAFKLVETFLLAWAGSRLTTESENYRDAVYASNWHANKPFMSSVVIMLTQKPMTLTACKFSTVSVGIFMKVVNTAVSYFCLLQTLVENE